MYVYKSTLLALGLCLVVAGCSSTGGGSQSSIDYRQIKTLPTLDIPPDLTTPETSGSMQVPTLSVQQAGDERQGGTVGKVLPTADDTISIKRDGAIRWLSIKMPAEELWPKLREFWPTIGLELKKDEPAIGIMETNWAENRIDVPESFLRGLVARIWKGTYSADTRDKYRLRVEPQDSGESEVFITHFGVIQAALADNIDASDTTPTWQTRPSDPELAYEVMNRLVIYLGGSEGLAGQAEKELVVEAKRARIEADNSGKTVLVINEGYVRAWRLAGIAIDRVGLVLEDQNRAEGIYFIQQGDLLADAGVDNDNWFTRTFRSDKGVDREAKYRLVLHQQDGSTQISVHDEAGERIDTPVARKLLQRLAEELN